MDARPVPRASVPDFTKRETGATSWHYTPQKYQNQTVYSAFCAYFKLEASTPQGI
jgi:hypothetical protein